MNIEASSWYFTRRQFISFAAGVAALGGRSYAFAPDFWNKKAPADWSPDEVHQLLNKSPWAKPVTVEVSRGGSSGNRGGNNSGMGSGGMGSGGRGMGGGGNRGTGGGRSGPGGGGMGAGNTGGGMGGGGSAPRAGQQVKGVVRWESARPILDASKETLPDDFTNHYVISIIGIPLGGRRTDTDDSGQPKLSNSAVERIKAATTLTPKGKPAAQPDVVQVFGGALLLGFSKQSVPLSPDDKEVAFATTIGRMTVKAKFNFKEMVYRESLAL